MFWTEDLCGQHHCDKDHLWLVATGDSKTPAPPPETVLGEVGSFCVHLKVYFGGGNLKLRQSISAWAASQLFTHPEPKNQSEKQQQGLMLLRQTSSPSSTPSGSGGRHTWVVPRGPLFTFKCAHQTIWASDQILNGVQIMQQRFFYWGEEEVLVVLYFKALQLG